MPAFSTDDAMSSSTLYTIPSHEPFVDALARGVMAETTDDPLTLAQYQILLPTRRSCRSLREAFLRLGGGLPTLLPRMTPIGDVDEDELLLSEDLPGSPAGEILSLPPAISGLRRQLVLMRLILARDSSQSPDQAALLAAELARLMDQVATERLDFAGLEKLDVGDFADHWQETLDFLKLVTEHWPSILAGEDAIDPAERRNRLLEAQAAHWRDMPPDTPVIAAGSTGSIPATADLLAVIAALPNGDVILPGLDTGLDDEAWDSLGPTHPQFGLKHLLDHLGVARTDVRMWPASEMTGSMAPEKRAVLLRQALLPSPATGTPVASSLIDEEALDGVERIDCPDPGREAEVIAISMRQTLETPGKTTALITPDRQLARRVAAELTRWGIEVDDSAGTPLDQTPPGAFLRLVANMVSEHMAPVSLLAVLKHPLAACAMSPPVCRSLIRRLEIEALRGVRPEPGILGLRRAIDDYGRLKEHPVNADLVAFLDRLAEIISPLESVLDDAENSFAELLRVHVSVTETLAASDTESGRDRLWRGDAGEALSTFLAELHEALDGTIQVSGIDYATLLDTLMMGRVVRPRYYRHPRAFIWGPLEARLQHADTLILGGLNEGTWPPEPEVSPWMSRPMMAAFGLPLPERRIGLSAHDFAQAFAAPSVILTRAERVDGTPSVSSRWLRRIENLVSASMEKTSFGARNDISLTLATALDDPAENELVTPVPPAPKPPLATRPRSLSVTRIRTLQRDPYAIYARYVLGLKPLDPIDADPGAADKGVIIHDALETFLAKHMDHLPEDAEQRLLEAGRRAFGDHLTRPGVRAFWWPRFERIAHWFIAEERARRENGMTPAVIETSGDIGFEAPGGPFTLQARADRIDRLSGGGLAIIDYKTGAAATASQAESGLEPQLPLEAAMAEQGRFKGLGADEVNALTYIKLTGGRTPGEVRTLKFKSGVHEIAENAWQGLQQLIAEYDNADKPYHSHLRPMSTKEIGDYDHLARVREWLSEEDEA